MTLDPRAPVVIGVGQFLHHAAALDDALEPVALMCEAITAAARDAGLAAVPDVDSIRVVNLLSWRYPNPAALIAERLGITAGDLVYTPVGGNTPQSLVNTTAGEIQRGELDLAVLTGGESMHTRIRARKHGVELPWTTQESAPAPRIVGDDLVMNHPDELARQIMLPIQVYPMFETAIRAAAGRSPEEDLQRISELWARFSQVAADNPYAWLRTPMTAEQIRTPSPENRMIGLPYTKVMNSNNNVDMGAALIICSAATAERLGVARDRWVFVHAGTDCHEHPFISHRWSFAETPAVELGGQRVLELAETEIGAIDVVDLYSCFPSAVQLGAQSLGLGIDRQLTRTGGLAFAGGPWNNYVMHAIATVVAEVRERGTARGLVWANGGYTTKHAFGVYGTEPPAHGFRHDKPQDRIDAMPRRELAPPADAAGTATIEAYTVMHDRDGAPERAIAACLLADGRRAWGTSDDSTIAAAMCDGEWVGRSVGLDTAGNLQP